VSKTISRLAQDLGLKPDTIRYYERIGLLPEPDRTAGNYRVYDSGAADRLRFIKGGQRLGLKLDEIRELLDIKDTGLCPCGQTATLLRNRIAALDEELGRLTALRRELAGMIERWPDSDGEPEGVRWHCAGEVIPFPDKLSDWLCAGGGGCQPLPERK
jgi:DNA-binding transcriptional MerR regulator